MVLFKIRGDSMKRKLKTIFILLITIAIAILTYFDSTQWSLERVNVKHEIYETDKIDSSLDGMQIAFISDIHYNNFTTKERLSHFIEKLNNSNPDIVVFLGDVYDHPATKEVSADTQRELIQLLKTIKAPYGKFAVLGTHDIESEDTKKFISSNLYQADFELIEDNVLKIAFNGEETFNLIGLKPMSEKGPDLTKAFKNINEEQFNLVVTHTPDTFELIDKNLTDLMVAGHSHGGQLYLPILGPLIKMPYAQKYNRGKYNVSNSDLFVINGLGTTEKDVRLFSTPQILIYTLKKQ